MSISDLIDHVRQRDIRSATIGGEEYHVKELSAAQVGELSEVSRGKFAATAIAMALCEPDGTNIEISDHQIEALASGSSRMLTPLYDAVAGISGLDKDAIEDEEKNSSTTD
jgi:hypothetical protein